MEALRKCNDSDIVPVSFYAHSMEGYRDSKSRNNIDEIWLPFHPCGKDIRYKLKIRLQNLDFVGSFKVW